MIVGALGESALLVLGALILGFGFFIGWTLDSSFYSFVFAKLFKFCGVGLNLAICVAY
jgi:hypothetical protein